MPFSNNISLFGQRRTRLPAAPPPAPPPTYRVTPASNVAVINEGGAITFNIATTNVANGTVLHWTLFGGTATSADFTQGVNGGPVVIQNNAASFTLNAKADAISEGNEVLAVCLRTGGMIGPVVATSANVTIADTSPAVTYSAVPAAFSVNEGAALTINVTTTGVANGTTLYWFIDAPSVVIRPANSADFVSNAGAFTINNNAGSFTVTPVADKLTEGVETFRVNICTGSTNGPIVATCGTIEINDTSLSPPPPMTATLTMVDHANNRYNILSSAFHAGLTDSRNVFNLGTAAANIRRVAYFDLMVSNGPPGNLGSNGATVLASSIPGAYLYKTVPGPTGAVQFVPLNKNYTARPRWITQTGTAWIYVTQISYDATTKTGVYRIWEKQSLAATNALTTANSASTLNILLGSTPVWPHHPNTNSLTFNPASTAAWYTLVLPGNTLKFVWRIKASNQS